MGSLTEKTQARMDTMDASADSRTAPTVTPIPRVYDAIASVIAELARTGITKDRRNQQQNYAFRGIDDVYNALAPLLAKHKLIVLPRVLSRECVERTTKSGNAQFFVVVESEFDFVSALDGSVHTAKTYGEAQDTADKATNKAMSAAYKYAAFMTFCIPTEGDNDADASTSEPVQPRAPESVTEPQGYDEWLAMFSASANGGFEAMRASFKDAPAAFRDYLLKRDSDRYNAILARAKAKDKAAA